MNTFTSIHGTTVRRVTDPYGIEVVDLDGEKLYIEGRRAKALGDYFDTVAAERREREERGRVNHLSDAREWLEGAERKDVDFSATVALANLAQVHATLALVQEQRGGNDLTREMKESNDILLEQMRQVTEVARAGWEAHNRVVEQTQNFFFAAHPVEKGWLDAAPGEVWELTTTDAEAAPYVVGSGEDKRFFHVERRLLAVTVDSDTIVAGRKVWPQGAS